MIKKGWNKPHGPTGTVQRPRGLLPTPGRGGSLLPTPPTKQKGLLPHPAPLPILPMPEQNLEEYMLQPEREPSKYNMMQKKPLLHMHQPAPILKPALLPSPQENPSFSQQQWQNETSSKKPVGTKPSGYRAPAQHNNVIASLLHVAPRSPPQARRQPLLSQSPPRSRKPPLLSQSPPQARRPPLLPHSPPHTRKPLLLSQTLPDTRRQPNAPQHISKESRQQPQRQMHHKQTPKIQPPKRNEPDNDAYRLHKEKLAKKALATSAARFNKKNEFKPKPQQQPQQSKSNENVKESSDGLDRLATFLLAMKSNHKSPTPPPPTQQLDSIYVMDDTEEKEGDNGNVPEKSAYIENTRNITDATLLEGEGFSDLSAINESLEKQLLGEESLLEEKIMNGTPADSQESASKPKKQKIQLSQYASGSDVAETTVTEKKVDNKLSSNIKAAPKKDFCQNSGSDLVYVVDDEDYDMTKEVKNEMPLLAPIQKSESFSDVKIPIRDETPAKSSTLKRDDNKPTSSNQVAKEVKKEKCELDDLPYIFPVSGFFCDVCCDFFFDKASTTEHIKTAPHIQKVDEAAKKKAEEGAKRKPSLNEEPSDTKKQKISFGQGGGFSQPSSAKQSKRSWNKSTKTGGNRFKQTNVADSVYIVDSEETSSYNNNSLSNNRRQKSRKWKNFVIPKRS